MDEATNGETSGPLAGAEGTAHRLTAAEWGLLLVLASIQFTHIVDFMIIMPLGPEYIKEMGLSTEQFGRMVSAYTISAGLASLLAARFLDRFDRKIALLCLYGGFIVGTLLCAAAPTYLLLLAARTVAGAFGGVTAAVVYAIVGDVFTDSRRGTAMGTVMYGFSVATIAGVPMGLLLAEHFGWQAPFVVLGMLSALVLTSAAFLLPPMRGHLAGSHRQAVSAWAVATDPNHISAFLLMLALVTSSFLLAPFVATFLEFNVGLAKESLKYVYLSGGLMTLLTLTVFGRLSDRFGKLPVFRVLGLATAVPFLWIPNLPVGAGMTVVLLATTSMFIFSSGRMVPAMALITNTAAPRVRGSFMSLNSAVQQLGAGVAAWIGGMLLNTTEGAEANGPLIGYPTVGLVAAAAAVVSVFLAGWLRPAPGGASAPDAEAVEATHHHFAKPCVKEAVACSEGATH